MVMQKYRFLPFLVDLFFCLVLLPVLCMLLPVERWLTNDPRFVYLLASWLYVVYVTNRLLLVRLCFRKGRYLLLALVLLLAGIAVTWLLTRYQMELPEHRLRRLPGEMRRSAIQQQAVWFLYIIVMAFSAAVGLLGEVYRLASARKDAEMEKKKAELALYKAQINPHFLFNTLNTLYGMIVTGSDRTEKAFTEFTSLMKYMYTCSTMDKVPVETEVQYIRDYISLQKYRVPEHTEVDFSVSGDNTLHLDVAPMIMVTFVENAFKYGVSSTVPGRISVSLSAGDGVLSFSCRNLKVNLPAGKVSNGIGIENCRRRLELLYRGRYSLEVGEKDNWFDVNLTVRL